MTGSLLPWWGWLLALQAVFVFALFDYVRRNGGSAAPKDADRRDLEAHQQAINNAIENARAVAERADKRSMEVSQQLARYPDYLHRLHLVRQATECLAELDRLDGFEDEVKRLSDNLEATLQGIPDLVRQYGDDTKYLFQGAWTAATSSIESGLSALNDLFQQRTGKMIHINMEPNAVRDASEVPGDDVFQNYGNQITYRRLYERVKTAVREAHIRAVEVTTQRRETKAFLADYLKRAREPISD